MQKLLITSQTSDVGKTTSAINLAAVTAMEGAKVLLVEADAISSVSSYLQLSEHSNRQSLREIGIDLPGALCCDVIPGLDVMCPYDVDGCTDDDLDQVLSMLGDTALQEGYDCLIVNAPPFMGGRPGSLLKACPQLVIVLRAESTAHRTMPAFLQLVQRAADAENISIKMRGFLVTLPETETIGGRAEREIRGRFGHRVLPASVPFDEEIPKAQMFGHIVAHTSEMSLAGQAYRELVAHLELATDSVKTAKRSSQSALVMAASGAKNRSSEPATPAAPPRSQPPVKGGRPASPPNRNQGWNTAKSNPASRPAPAPQPADAPENHGTPAWIPLVLVGLSMLCGFVLRFVQLPKSAMPIAIGIAVSAATILVMKLFMAQNHEEKLTQQVATVSPSGGSGAHHRIPKELRRKRQS